MLVLVVAAGCSRPVPRATATQVAAFHACRPFVNARFGDPEAIYPDPHDTRLVGYQNDGRAVTVTGSVDDDHAFTCTVARDGPRWTLKKVTVD